MADRPIRVFYSVLTDTFYATKHWRERNGYIEITGKKYDVTQDVARAVVEHRVEFTSVLVTERPGKVESDRTWEASVEDTDG